MNVPEWINRAVCQKQTPTATIGNLSYDVYIARAYPPVLKYKPTLPPPENNDSQFRGYSVDPLMTSSAARCPLLEAPSIALPLCSRLCARKMNQTSWPKHMSN